MENELKRSLNDLKLENIRVVSNDQVQTVEGNTFLSSHKRISEGLIGQWKADCCHEKKGWFQGELLTVLQHSLNLSVTCLTG